MQATLISGLGAKRWIPFPEQHRTVLLCSLERDIAGYGEAERQPEDKERKGEREVAVNVMLLNDKNILGTA